MTRKSPEFPDDRTAKERRKNLTEEEIRELELAGGVEGGMRAGSAGPKRHEDPKEEEAPKKPRERR